MLCHHLAKTCSVGTKRKITDVCSTEDLSETTNMGESSKKQDHYVSSDDDDALQPPNDEEYDPNQSFIDYETEDKDDQRQFDERFFGESE